MTPPPPGHRHRTAGLVAAALAACIMAGCNTTPPLAHRIPSTQPSGEAPVLGVEPIAGGIYESLGTTTPLSGEELFRASLSRKEIEGLVQAKAAPATQPAASATEPVQKKDTEPPPLAIKYYLQGRENFLQGANSEAMNALEKALQLDPDAFTVLRLMGRVCFAASQLARGSMYLERAQRLRPADVEVNYLLGRYWLERKDFDRAVYYLMLADGSPEQKASSTQMPLSAFYLARALQSDRYHHAAAKAYERFLNLAGLPVAAYRYDRELSYLIDEQWAAHLAAAENFALVGEYVQAIPHYQKAMAEQPRDAFIASRLVNALMHAGRFESARQASLALLMATHGNEQSIKLLAWTYRSAGREQELIPQLAAQMHTAASSGTDEDDAALTLAAAQDYLGQGQQAFSTLRNYLERHPTNLDVLQRLFKRVNSAESYGEALQAAAGAIVANRALAEDVVKSIAPLFASASAKAYLRLTGQGEQSYAASYLRALTRQAQRGERGTFEQIRGDFAAAIAAAPDFLPARDAYVSWLLQEERFTEANEIVQQAVRENPNSPKAWQLLIESEAAQQRLTSALKLAQDARTKFPASAEIWLELGGVYRLRGQIAQADSELQALVNAMPKFEPAYRALINALFAESRRAGGGGGEERRSVDSYMTQIVTNLTRLTREIPTSRFGQVHTAIFFARSGRLEEAEAMLTRLLSDKSDDADALIALSQVKQALHRPADAISTLENAIENNPQPDLVRAMAGLYDDQEKEAQALALTRKMMQDHPDSDTYAIIYAGELSGQDKNAEAIGALQEARKRMPHSLPVARMLWQLQDQTEKPLDAIATVNDYLKDNGENSEVLYSLSHLYSAAGNDEASERTLRRVLEIMPDHTGANNDLGYFWADAGIHMEQAEKMIRSAVDNRPNDSAFADSLGWLLYKQGRFPEAITALQRAIGLPDGNQPEVIQHLGDALYRAGRAPEAIERWSQARDRLIGVAAPSRQEQKLREYLDGAIAAAKAGRAPRLSPLAASEPAGPRAERPAAAGSPGPSTSPTAVRTSP